MHLSYFLMLLNPLLMVAGVAYICIKVAPNRPFPTNQDESESDVKNEVRNDDSDDSDDDDEGGGGGIAWDWDAPLDLPPGVYVLPPEPVGELV